jgi:hypothetical protein
MKPYTLEIDDETLIEQLSKLNNPEEFITNVIKSLFSENKSEYDSWFKQQIQLALREADDPNTQWVSHETMTETSLAHRNQWLAQTQQKAA